MKQNVKLNYLIAAGIGAVAGGILVAAATNAIPTMMGKMMARMGEEGCTPQEM
jgi:hypothetical protein